MAKVGDSGDSRGRGRTRRRESTSGPARSERADGPNRNRGRRERANRSESPRGDETRIHGHRHRRRSEALDRDPEETSSDASAGREQVRRAGESSRRTTSESPRFVVDAVADAGDSSSEESSPAEETSAGRGAYRYASVDAAEQAGEPTADGVPSEDEGSAEFDLLEQNLVENPVEEEQSSSLPQPPDSVAGEIPPAPNLDQATVTDTRGGPDLQVEDLEHDGIEYQRVTAQDGTVQTSYTVDGVSYQNTRQPDGGTRQVVTTTDENGVSHTRTVARGADGALETDTTQTRNSAEDPQTGREVEEARTVVVDASGARTTTEEVTRPDGGQSTRTVVNHPDGRTDEVYRYEGDEGTQVRTTNTTPDGASRSETQRSYQVEESIEELTEGPEVPGLVPQQPSYNRGRGPAPEPVPLVGPLPEAGRSPTDVTEVEVTVTSPEGETTVVHDETTYSQTSSDVGFRDPVYQENPRGGRRQTAPGTFPGEADAFTASPEDSSVTRTVRVGTTTGPDGEQVDINEASQTVTVAGVRNSDGGEVSNTVTHSWNAAGESTSSYASTGYTRDEQVGNTGRVTVGGESVALTASADGKTPDQHLRDKGGHEVEDFLGVDGEFDAVLDSSVVISRNSEGETVGQTAVLSTVDAYGNGRTVTRNQPEEGPVSWTYSNHSDNGRDYQRQTVFEGSDLSIYETHNGHADGTFRSTSETKSGDDVVGTSVTERRELSEEDIQAYARDGELTSAEADALIAEGGPFFVDTATNQSDQAGDEPAIDFESTSFSTGTGYTLGYTSNTETQESGEATRTSFRTVSDPDGEVPFQGQLRRETRGSEDESFTLAESGPLTISRDGTVRFQGEEISSGAPVPTDTENLGFADIVSYTSGASGGLAETFQVDRVTPPTGLQKDPLTERINNPALERLGNFADIVSAYGAAHQVWDAVSAREISWSAARQYAEGVGGLATGGSAAADIVEAIAVRSASRSAGTAAAAGSRATGIAGTAAKVSKVLGPVGAVVGGVVGVADLFTADSGYDRAAAALGVAAVGAAFIPVVGWAASLVLGVASFVVGAGDQNNTAGVDERLRE